MSDSKANGAKISNGQNARARTEPIGTSNGGIPDDSSSLPDISKEEEQAITRKIRGEAEGRGAVPSGPEMPYDVSHAESEADDDDDVPRLQGEQELGSKR